jgi:hypothetical protein
MGVAAGLQAMARLRRLQKTRRGRAVYLLKALAFGPLILIQLAYRQSGKSTAPQEAGADIYPVF